jgi:hypothetical protein
MRVLGLMPVLFLVALCASAQTISNPSAGPEVTVMQKKWRMDVRNPALEKDPIKIMNEREEEERKRKAAEKMNETRTQQGMPAVVRPGREPARDFGNRELSVTYIYEVKVRNTGAKPVRSITWEYVFFDPDTKQEVGRQRFESEVRISPGGTKNLVMRSASSPTGTIEATKVDKKSKDQYSEKVVIQSVKYADGSVWQATSN